MSRPRSRGRTAGSRPRAGRRPRTRLELDERRAQLLELAMRMFGDRAYDEVSIDDLAREAGVSKGLVYHYFPTKRDLYVAGLTRAAQQLLERTIIDAPELSPLERMRVSLDAFLGYVGEHAVAYTALLRGGIGSDPEVARIIEDTRSVYVNRLIDGIVIAPLPRHPHDTPLLAHALRGWVGFVEAISVAWVGRRDVAQREVRDLLVDALLAVVPLATGRSLTRSW